MRSQPRCPRCQRELLAPSLWSTAWRCEAHGDVPPFHTVTPVGPDSLRGCADRAKVPLWTLWPLPPGWLVSGLAWAGDDRAPAVATALALSGPALVGGPADLVLVAEEPGVGLAGGLAGLGLVDPGRATLADSPVARISAAGHPTPLWAAPTPPSSEVAAYVGEASGCWLWVLAWPSETGLELHDHAGLVDLRDPGHPLDLPFGAPSPRLSG